MEKQKIKKYMTIKVRTIIFVVLFSFLFVCFRRYEQYEILVSDVAGLPWLYSAIATLFSFIVAFIIQKEWELWNHLSDKTQGQVSVLRELIAWGKLDASIYTEIQTFVRTYSVSIQDEWGRGGTVSRSTDLDGAIEKLRAHIVLEGENVKVRSLVQSTFLQLIKIRNSRLEYSTHHVPPILKIVLIGAGALVVFLSLFVGVKSFALDYLFTVSIATLVFSLHVVIDDLDNPFRPGAWHLTPDAYTGLVELL